MLPYLWAYWVASPQPGYTWWGGISAEVGDLSPSKGGIRVILFEFPTSEKPHFEDPNDILNANPRDKVRWGVCGEDGCRLRIYPPQTSSCYKHII